MNQIIYIAALVALVIAPSRSGSQNPPLDLFTAAAQFNEQFDAAEAGKRSAPRLSMPEDARLFHVAFDRDRLREIPVNDMQVVLESCIPSMITARRYTLFGIVSHASTRPLSASEDLTAKANVLKYQDEISFITAAADICMKRIAIALNQKWKLLSPEQRQKGNPRLLQIRAGILGSIDEILSLESHPAFSKANKALLAVALLDEADNLLLILSSNERSRLRSRVTRTLSDPRLQERPRLSEFARVIDTTPCADLCLVP